MSKRYVFNVVEHAVVNPDYKGYRAGRIEIHDTQLSSAYAAYTQEVAFLMPKEFFDRFYKLFDGKETDLMPYIIGNYKGEANNVFLYRR